jgi:hypothetical protein
MRSVSVVLPLSMWAEMPMLRTSDSAALSSSVTSAGSAAYARAQANDGSLLRPSRAAAPGWELHGPGAVKPSAAASPDRELAISRRAPLLALHIVDCLPYATAWG